MPVQNRVVMDLRTDRSAVTNRSGLVAAIVIIFLTLTFFLIQYDRLRGAEPNLQIWHQFKRSGTLSEGDQYRIGIPFLAHFLAARTPLEMRQSIPIIQSLCYGTGLTALYLLLVSSSLFNRAERAQRLLMCAIFFAVVQFPILWIFPWERPETLPTMGYLAVISLVIVEERVALPLACLLAVLLSLMQSTARTDAPLVMGLATVIAAALFPFRRSRGSVALLGLLCAATGAVTQFYLHHLYPSVLPEQRATTLQLFRNINPFYSPFHIPEFLTAMLPFVFSMLLIRRHRLRLDATDKLILLVSLIYLPIYIVFGFLAEIRIYVPYLFLLAPVIAKLWAQFLWADPADPATA
jgi:hypothetical protein